MCLCFYAGWLVGQDNAQPNRKQLIDRTRTLAGSQWPATLGRFPRGTASSGHVIDLWATRSRLADMWNLHGIDSKKRCGTLWELYARAGTMGRFDKLLG